MYGNIYHMAMNKI